MTAVTESNREEAVIDGIKTVIIKSDSACASGFTIDLGSDSAGGTFKEIYTVHVEDADGNHKTMSGSLVNKTTGVVTLPTVTTGVHYIKIVGI